MTNKRLRTRMPRTMVEAGEEAFTYRMLGRQIVYLIERPIPGDHLAVWAVYPKGYQELAFFCGGSYPAPGDWQLRELAVEKAFAAARCHR